MFLVRKREIINLNLSIFKPLVAFAALGMGDISRFWERDCPFGVASRTCGFLSLVAFETSLFRRSKCRWIMGVMVNIVVTGGTRVFQLLDMEMVRDPDAIRINFRGS